MLIYQHSWGETATGLSENVYLHFLKIYIYKEEGFYYYFHFNSGLFFYLPSTF